MIANFEHHQPPLSVQQHSCCGLQDKNGSHQLAPSLCYCFAMTTCPCMSPFPTAQGQSDIDAREMGGIHTPRQSVPSHAMAVTLQAQSYHTKTQTYLCGNSCPPAQKRKGNCPWYELLLGDAQMALIRLLDCELQTWAVIQRNSLLFKAMLFIASHQKTYEHLTHKCSNMRLETGKKTNLVSVESHDESCFSFMETQPERLLKCCNKVRAASAIVLRTQSTMHSFDRNTTVLKQQNQTQYLQP